MRRGRLAVRPAVEGESALDGLDRGGLRAEPTTVWTIIGEACVSPSSS